MSSKPGRPLESLWLLLTWLPIGHNGGVACASLCSYHLPGNDEDVTYPFMQQLTQSVNVDLVQERYISDLFFFFISMLITYSHSSVVLALYHNLVVVWSMDG